MSLVYKGHHFCEKHKERKEYNSFFKEWRCESCLAEKNKRPVIYQELPIKRIK